VATANALQLEAARAHLFCLWRCDLDLWSLTLNICSVSPVTGWNSLPNLIAIEQCDGVIAISIFGSDIIFTTFDLRQLIRAWIIAFLGWYVSRCDLCPIDLENSLFIKRYVNKVCTKYVRNRAIRGMISRIFAHVMSRCDLWSVNLELSQHIDVICLNSVQILSEIE